MVERAVDVVGGLGDAAGQRMQVEQFAGRYPAKDRRPQQWGAEPDGRGAGGEVHLGQVRRVGGVQGGGHERGAGYDPAPRRDERGQRLERDWWGQDGGSLDDLPLPGLHRVEQRRRLPLDGGGQRRDGEGGDPPRAGRLIGHRRHGTRLAAGVVQ